MASLKRVCPTGLIVLLLALTTLFVFWPVTRFGFVNYDDLAYVTENPMVQHGVTVETARWAFATTHAGNWHPLTWLSHSLDWRLYGPKAGGHHLTSLLLHMANTLLLFLVFLRMTGACWRSGILAGLFAWHPLRVESVVWVAERKDVLSTFFFLLTIWAYARYARKRAGVEVREPDAGKPPPALDPRPSTLDYTLALLFFALGLMCKPMVVTLPFVLLLLDYWPLQRWGAGVRLPGASKRSGGGPTLDLRLAWRLALEKLPFLALAGLSSVVTFIVQKHAGSVVALAELSYASRIANACISYVRYLGKMIWPARLSPLYPFEFHWPMWQVVLAGLLLLGGTFFAIKTAKRRPYCFVGWFWYLGTLVPVIGLVQVGSQSMADRYTYIPLIGIFLALTWGLADILQSRVSSKVARAIIPALVLGLCIGRTREQLWHWQNTETLFRYALRLNPKNAVAYNNLGCDLIPKGRIDEAMACFKKAIQLQLRCGDPYVNLGWILAGQGKVQEAFDNYNIALTINTNDVAAHVRMGKLLVGVGSLDVGIAHFLTDVRLNPLHVDALNDLGIAFSKKDRPDQALIYFRAALRLKPNYPEALNNLANVLAAQNHWDEAVTHYLAALRLKPDYINARYNLGDALGKMGRSDEAIQQLGEVLRRKPDDAEAHNRLGEILARQGKAKEALQSYETALRLQPDLPDALKNKAWILATCPDPQFRNGGEALRLARRALELTSAENIHALDALAAAYAETGQFSQAVDSAEKALALARASNQVETAARIQSRLECYRAAKPFREP